MVLKVRAGVPLVWRSPSSLQFGVDEPLAVLDGLSEGTERLVAALVSGVSASGLDMMARTVGYGDPAPLLAALAPVLEGADEAQLPGVGVLGTGSVADELRAILTAEGLLVAADEATLIVIVADWLVGVEDHGTWLRRDLPHVPVVVGDGGVTIGPFVEPGSGPCLYCVELTRTDADPAWPAIATQLWNRPAPPLTRLAASESAAFAARRIRDRLTTGAATAARSWRVASADGRVTERQWTRHPDCRCAAPAESDWAPVAAPVTRSATTTAAAAAVPA